MKQILHTVLIVAFVVGSIVEQKQEYCDQVVEQNRRLCDAEAGMQGAGARPAGPGGDLPGADKK